MGQIILIDISDSNRWDNIVKSFYDYDVYYLSGYVKAFKVHGDGDPLLVYYKSDELRGIIVVMKRDISQFPPFRNKIQSNTMFDIVTPYGYGGFIFEGNINESNISGFCSKYDELLSDKHIISEFVRYHPLLKNANYMRSLSTVIDLGFTISMDLNSEEVIWSNLTSKNRNMIRKARKSGIQIRHGKGLELLNEFMDMYNATMNKDNALEYYYFNSNFYSSLHNDLFDNYEIFYSLLGDKIISMSIIIFANNHMHYHLSGSRFEYKQLAPTNLLLYEAAIWGCKKGFSSFHLGGGFGSGEDDLYKFKRSFNRNSNNLFSIGRRIFNQEVYDSLVDLRVTGDSDFHANSSFFPLYRA